MDDTAPTRLLLVDDEVTLREPLADYLARQGFVVRQAAALAMPCPTTCPTWSCST